MECSVFDTWVDKKEGGKMHFDIIVPVNTGLEAVLKFGNQYLEVKNQKGQPLDTKNCTFCHIEKADDRVESLILNEGHYILDMAGCD